MDNLGKYVYAEQKRQEGTGYMKQQTVYLKCDRSAEVQAQDVFLKDVQRFAVRIRYCRQN